MKTEVKGAIITCHQVSDGHWGTQMDVYTEGR